MFLRLGGDNIQVSLFSSVCGWALGHNARVTLPYFEHFNQWWVSTTATSHCTERLPWPRPTRPRNYLWHKHQDFENNPTGISSWFFNSLSMKVCCFLSYGLWLVTSNRGISTMDGVLSLVKKTFCCVYASHCCTSRHILSGILIVFPPCANYPLHSSHRTFHQYEC